VCATPGELDHFAVLALQQNGQQSALHNVVFSVFHKRLFT
jgi:hypothetical protein